MNLSPLPIQRFYDDNNFPLVGGKLFTYIAGITTKQATYIDSTGGTPNTNPIVLNFRGEAQVWIDPLLTYKFVLAPATDTDPPTNPIWSVDQLASGLTYTNLVTILTQQFLGQIIYPRTAAEIAAGVTPTNYIYPEGDIRRYGAATGASNNAVAINNALSISAAGGSAAYIPAGTWSITAALQAPAKSSMYGEGALSIIQPTAAVDGLQFALDPTAQPARRSFRGFALISTNGGANSGISCTVQPSAAWSIDFLDIGIQNFQTAINAQGFRACNFTAISGFNNYGGISFAGQNTNCEVIGCQFIRGTITGAGGAYGIRIQQSGGNTTQSTQITDCYIFGYDIGLKNDLSFETQVMSCDFSNCLIKAIEVTSTIGGFWVEDCWLEVINPAQTHGVDVANITPTTTAKVYINRNFLRATTAVAGTIGINIGNANAGAMVEGNHVLGFDKGINIGAATNVTCRANTVNINTTVYSATSYGIQLNSSANDVQLGPNYIVPGTPAAVTMANASTSLLVTPAGYPVGTPIQFDASQNGFFVGVTYYVVGVGGNFIQAGATPGGAAIAATGAVAVNVFQAPLPVVLTGATPPPGFNFCARGSFLGSLTGFTGTVQSPMDWVVNGYSPVITVRGGANLVGTSSATTMTMVGVPSLLYPVTATQSFMASTEDAGAFGYGLASMSTAGVFSFFKTPGGAVFTNSGQKGIGNFPMTYTYT